jgi:hypothetical protein
MCGVGGRLHDIALFRESSSGTTEVFVCRAADWPKTLRGCVPVFSLL